MRFGTIVQSVGKLRKRLLRSTETRRWERRLNHEIDALYRRQEDRLLPDFLILGAPKCATSWLQGALAQHAQVRITPGEIEYFSSHIDRPLEWYLDRFESLIGVSEGKGRLRLGEKSAGYCGISPARIRLVHRFLPDARLILMIRDPVARHWSHAKRHFSKEKWQRKGPRSLESRQQLYEYFLRTRRFGEFSKMISNWTSVYPPARLLVISQEAALVDPAHEFERALRHIEVGLSQDLVKKWKRILGRDKNRGPSVPMPEDVKDYLERMFEDERRSLSEILKAHGGSAPTGLFSSQSKADRERRDNAEFGSS